MCSNVGEPWVQGGREKERWMHAATLRGWEKGPSLQSRQIFLLIIY